MKKQLSLLIVIILLHSCNVNNNSITKEEVKKTVISSEKLVDFSNIDNNPNY